MMIENNSFINDEVKSKSIYNQFFSQIPKPISAPRADIDENLLDI